jgi:septum formation protein
LNKLGGFNLYLASGSPRRKELLTQLGYSFDILRPEIIEKQAHRETSFDYVARLAVEKAQAGLTLLPSSATEKAIVIGSDTIVTLDNEVFEKPRDLQHSIAMLSRLSGNKHQVATAVAIVSETQKQLITCITDVWFKPLSVTEIEQYWETGEPCDKAGSYGIQGIGGKFVTRIEGSYHAVVGLPLFETEQLLHQFLSEI